MKFQRIALLLTAFFLILNCLSVTASGKETERDISSKDYISDNGSMDADDMSSVLPETGDELIARLKITGTTVIASACLLLLLNYRKRI